MGYQGVAIAAKTLTKRIRHPIRPSNATYRQLTGESSNRMDICCHQVTIEEELPNLPWKIDNNNNNNQAGVLPSGQVRASSNQFTLHRSRFTIHSSELAPYTSKYRPIVRSIARSLNRPIDHLINRSIVRFGVLVFFGGALVWWKLVIRRKTIDCRSGNYFLF